MTEQTPSGNNGNTQQPPGGIAGVLGALSGAFTGLSKVYSLYQYFSGMPTEQEKIKAELDKIQQQISDLSIQVSTIPAQIQEQLIGQQYYTAYNTLLQDVISYEKGELTLNNANIQPILEQVDSFNLTVTGLGSEPSFLHLRDQELRRTYSPVMDYFQSMSSLFQMSASLLTRLNRMLGQCAHDLWLHAGVQERFRKINDSIKFLQDFVDKAGMYPGDGDKKPPGPLTGVALLLVDDIHAKPEEWKLAQSRSVVISSSQAHTMCFPWYEAELPSGEDAPVFWISCGLASKTDTNTVVFAFEVRPANDNGSVVTFGFAERHFWGPLGDYVSPSSFTPADNKTKCPPFPSSWYEFQIRVGSSGDRPDQFVITTSTHRNRYDTDSASAVWCWHWRPTSEPSPYYADSVVDMAPIPVDGTPLGADWLFTIVLTSNFLKGNNNPEGESP